MHLSVDNEQKKTALFNLVKNFFACAKVQIQEYLWKSFGHGEAAPLLCMSNISLLTRCDNRQMMNFSWRFLHAFDVFRERFSIFHGEYLLSLKSNESSAVMKYSFAKFVIILAHNESFPYETE